MLKIRYSYGKTGNDALYEGNKRVRFPYLYSIATDNNVYHFEDIGTGEKLWNGKYYSTVASPAISWEVATKQDLGIDFSLFNDKLTGEIDYFKERRDGIYMTRSYIPYEVGIDNASKANVGIVEAKGFDGHFAFKQKLGKVNFTLRGNITYSKNKVIEKDEENTIYEYKLAQGHRVNQARGLIALGLFKDYEEIRNSPKQTFGEVMPGDIKYKDVNGDGRITEDDQVPLAYSNYPLLMYGFGGEFRYKSFTLACLFKGTGNTTYFKVGNGYEMGYVPFHGEKIGNVPVEAGVQANRWTPAWYSGDPSTENPNAAFPRLSYGKNENNTKKSTFWKDNARYLRLQEISLTYNLKTKGFVKRLGIQSFDFQLVGYNLAVWSGVKTVDPEQAQKMGRVYPIPARYAFQTYIHF